MFRFSLQRVLDIRAQTEQTAAVHLAEAKSRLQQANDQKAEIEGALEEGIARLSTGAESAPTVGEMRSRCYVLAQLDERLARAQHGIVAAEAEEEQRREEFATAFRDRRVLDRLKERHLEAWREEAVKADLATMDGIALSRFATRAALELQQKQTPPAEQPAKEATA
jgi:flagellar protein FliJ